MGRVPPEDTSEAPRVPSRCLPASRSPVPDQSHYAYTGHTVPSASTYPEVSTHPMANTRQLRADLPDVLIIMGSICDKWALLILHQLSRGKKRHGELKRSLHGISDKMLTQTLRKLERDRLVQRTVHPVVPPRVDYALTRLGRTLTAPLHELYRWTERHLPEIQRARRAADSQQTQPS